MNVASYLYNRVLRSRGLQRKLWERLRRLFVSAFNDPDCVMRIHGRDLTIPLSHALPQYLQTHRLYDRLPARLSEFIREREGDVFCVDVGANVGDTIAAFCRDERDRFVAIEPNPKFSRYLKKNWGDSQNVLIVEKICSSSDGLEAVKILENAGTAKIVKDSQGTSIRQTTLSTLARELDFGTKVNIIKTDTDGHDLEVLHGAEELLKLRKPALLFECDAFRKESFKSEFLAGLKRIHACGYESMLVYDNIGYLMGRIRLTDTNLIEDLVRYQLVSDFCYFDLLVLEEGAMEVFHQRERAFFGSLPV